MKDQLETKTAFIKFGRDVEKSTKIYSYLSKKISEDQELLEMVSKANLNDQIPPLILFGSVQYLLLKNLNHPLQSYYPSLGGRRSFESPEFYQIFKDFCTKYVNEIKTFISTKIIQTNEVRRSGILLLGFNWILQREKQKNLSTIEIGCSMGLNLYWDKYCYKIEDKTIKQSECDLLITSTFRGDTKPIIELGRFEISDRIGIDKNPLESTNEEDKLWLRALIWPEEVERLISLKKAIEISSQKPVTLLRGDILEQLPIALKKVKKETLLVVVQSFTFYLMKVKGKEKVMDLLREYSWKRTIYLLSIEWLGLEGRKTVLKVYRMKNGQKETTTLAQCHPHGDWVKWLDQTSIGRKENGSEGEI